MTSDRAPENNSNVRRVGSRFPTGRVLAGRYELLESIGQGGTADVFRARDHRLDRVVAVKVLRPEFGQDSTARTRFAVEARSAAALNVRNIVPVYDFGAADDGSLFIVMRYIDGPSLRLVLSEQRPLPTVAALDVGRQIAEALAEAHAHGLIHRDVKPGNILIAHDGTAHLTDFGTVKALGETDALTRSGTIFGTAAYLSPEQVTGGSIGPWTDVYGLGVVLYEALSGVLPFVGDDPVSLSYRHAHETPKPLSALVPSLDAEVAGLVMACLAKSPSERPADARRVASTLDMASRRIAPRVAAAAGLAEVAARIGTSPASTPPLPNDNQLTKAIAVPASMGAAAMAMSGGAISAAAAGARPPTSVVAASEAATVSFPPPEAVPSPPRFAPTPLTPVARGVVQPPSRVREQARNGSRLGASILLVALGVLAFGAVLLFGRLLTPSQDDGGVGALPTDFRTTAPTVTITAIPTIEPSIEVTPAVATARPTPITVTPLPGTPEPTRARPTPAPPTQAPVTPEPTPPSATEPPPRPTDEPTPAPPPAPPPASTVVVRVPDSRFVGDYPDDGRYHGRTAAWVYGQLTPYNTMTSTFELDQTPTSRRATVEVVGLDGENPAKNDVRFVLNGVTLYEGPNPLPNDTCCGGSGPGNWGSVSFRVPTSLLAPSNELSVSNLEPNDCTQCPKFVMVDYVEISYRTGG